MIFGVLLLAIVAPLLLFQVRWAYRRRLLMKGSWEGVLSRIERVDVDGIRAVADCYLHPDQHQLSIEPNEMWELLGGLEGISRLGRNAAAIVDLAIYAQRWNDAEGGAVTEMIRRDAARLNESVTRIQLTFFCGLGFVRAPFHVQEAAAAYYLMRGRLLGLYQNSHVSLVSRLEAAV